MKVFVQVIDTKTGIYQTGMIEEPITEGFEIKNALAHFGVVENITWEVNNSKKYYFGYISGTTKVVSVVAI